MNAVSLDTHQAIQNITNRGGAALCLCVCYVRWSGNAAWSGLSPVTWDRGAGELSAMH